MVPRMVPRALPGVSPEDRARRKPGAGYSAKNNQNRKTRTKRSSLCSPTPRVLCHLDGADDRTEGELSWAGHSAPCHRAPGSRGRQVTGLCTGAGVSQGCACVCASEGARTQASYTRGCAGTGHSWHLWPRGPLQEHPLRLPFSLAPIATPAFRRSVCADLRGRPEGLVASRDKEAD